MVTAESTRLWTGTDASPTGPAADGPIRVVYIGGEGRSGSTVLEKALAAHPDVVAVGELKYLWKWGIRRNEFCACGKPVPDCEFWSAVGRRLFGPEGFRSPDAADILDDYETISSNWRMGDAFVGAVLPSSRRRLARVRAFLTQLYRAIAAEAGAEVVVDASKHPMHLAVVRGAPDLDLTVVQLVRHPAGVVSSWSRKVALPHDPTGRRTMGPHPAPVVVLRWALMNLAVQWVRLRTAGLVVRYEEFCRRPSAVIADILGAADVDPSVLAPSDGTEITVAAGHGVAGNPSRFGHEVITLREDDAWRQKVSPARQLAIKVALLPQMIQYGYLGRSRR